MKSEYADVDIFQAFLTILNDFTGYLVIRTISKATKVEFKRSKPDAFPSCEGATNLRIQQRLAYQEPERLEAWYGNEETLRLSSLTMSFARALLYE